MLEVVSAGESRIVLARVDESHSEVLGGTCVSLQEDVAWLVSVELLGAPLVEVAQSELVDAVSPIFDPFRCQLRASEDNVTAGECAHVVVEIQLWVVKLNARHQLVLAIVLGALEHCVQGSGVRSQSIQMRLIHLEAHLSQVFLERRLN